MTDAADEEWHAASFLGIAGNMNMWPVDLSVAATSIVEELRYREAGRQVRFNIREGIWVNADPVLIRVVVQNPLQNAWKFTARQDDASAEEGETCRYVRDNGAGFDQAYAESCFAHSRGCMTPGIMNR